MTTRGAFQVELASTLAAPRAEVWAVVSSMRGVNDELMPWLRMTYPRRASRLTAAAVVPGVVLFRSWLLAFGVVPFDLHTLVLVQVHDGEGFVEESSSWLERRWRHERWLTDAPSGRCVLTDRLLVEPRLPLARPIGAAIVRQLFAHRHRRLRARFGAG